MDWDEYERRLQERLLTDPGPGFAEECRNLKEAGWQGYDSDRAGMFEEVDPASLGIQDFK